MTSVTINLFETTKTFRNVALQVIEVLAKHGFNVGVIVNVKDYLSTMTNTLVFVVSCEVLGLTMHAKPNGTSFKSFFLSFMIYFQTFKIHNNMLTMMIDIHSNSIC
jgi:hypothetical protein